MESALSSRRQTRDPRGQTWIKRFAELRQRLWTGVIHAMDSTAVALSELQNGS